MKKFLDKDFLLNTEVAVQLYERAAVDLPIFDFHCHLEPKEIWEDTSYENFTQLMLAGDHYKWRVMRMHGIDENLITGDAPDWEKFEAWAETVPYLIGNPLYHWTHLELKNFFGVEKLLNPQTAREIYDECNEKLQSFSFGARTFIEKSNVKFIGTTDDPVSKLEFHQLLKRDESFAVTVAPTFRPDGALFIESPAFSEWIGKLAQVSEITINSLDSLVEALAQRVDFFHENGGRASDHDIQKMEFTEMPKQQVATIFEKGLSGGELSANDCIAFRSFLLKQLGKLYAKKEWVMQLHMGAMRSVNSKMEKRIGPNTGFDSIGEANMAEGLGRFLDALDREDALPRTVLFNLNPKDNAVLAGMMGNFFEAGILGKVQIGSGWWFNDQIDGMEKQLRDFANVGVLSHFIGMLTDSRSFLSYARHEYFRRILCNILGDWVEKGMIPEDMKFLEGMVKDIGYYNAERYFLER